MKRYMINNTEEVLLTMGFDTDDCEELIYCAINNNLLLIVDTDTNTVSVTPSDVDLYRYVIRNESCKEIVSSVLSDIAEMEKVGYVTEI